MSVDASRVRRVNQAVKLRVLPDDEEETALEQTLRTCNAAASWLSTQMHTARVFRKIDARHRFYTELRQRFGLGAQPANRVIGKVAGAYAALHANITAGNYGPPDPNDAARGGVVHCFPAIGGRSRSIYDVCRGDSPMNWAAPQWYRSGRSLVG
jgi:hypothetical protein